MSLPGVNRRHLAAGATLPPLKKDTLRIYNMKFCPYAHRTVLAIAAKKIPSDIINVHLKSKPDWFLERNPIGKVPTLELNDKIVYDSPICNEWLGSTCGYADYLLWPFLERIDLCQSEGIVGSPILTAEKFPKLSDYIQRMKQRSEVNAAMQDYKVHAAYIRAFMKGEPPQYDVGTVEEY